MEFTIEVNVQMTMDHVKGAMQSRHVETTWSLDVSEPLDRSQYFDAEDYPSPAGFKAATQTLIHGLIGSIAAAHELGYRNDAENLRYVIAELERGFSEVNTTTWGGDRKPIKSAK